MNANKVFAIFLALSAGFGFINMILVSSWAQSMSSFIATNQANGDETNIDNISNTGYLNQLVFLSIAFAATFISGTISAATIFSRLVYHLAGIVGEVGKLTIAITFIIHLQTVISIWHCKGKVVNAIIAVSILDSVIKVVGLVVLCLFNRKK